MNMETCLEDHDELETGELRRWDGRSWANYEAGMRQALFIADGYEKAGKTKEAAFHREAAEDIKRRRLDVFGGDQP